MSILGWLVGDYPKKDPPGNAATAERQKLRSTLDIGVPATQIALSPNSADVAASGFVGGTHNEIKSFRSDQLRQTIDTKDVREWFSFAPGGSLMVNYNLALTLHFLDDGKTVILVAPERLPKKEIWHDAVFSRSRRWLFATGSRK